MPSDREARLKREFAKLYPGLKTEVWYKAAWLSARQFARVRCDGRANSMASVVEIDRIARPSHELAYLPVDRTGDSTGPDERKAINLAANPHCVVTTGANQIGQGLDVVVEGDAVRVTNVDQLRAASAAFLVKYAGVFRYEVREDGSVAGGGGEVLLFRVAPQKAFGFSRDGGFSQTRWRFDANG